MKSKSFDLKKSAVNNVRHNKTFDFIGFYKTSGDSNISTNVKCISKDISTNDSPRNKVDTLKCERNSNKKKKNESVSVSPVDIDVSALNSSFGSSTLLNNTKMTSTPNGTSKYSVQANSVKSIMKNISGQDEDKEDTDIVKTHSKKRNKSVSFMLADIEEVAVKKIKPDEVNCMTEKSSFFKTVSLKKLKKVRNSQKENKNDLSDNVAGVVKSKTKLDMTKNKNDSQMDSSGSVEGANEEIKRKKMNKKGKKHKATHEPPLTSDNEIKIEDTIKIKKEKHQSKPQLDDGEPVKKARKTNIKPDVIAESLENLNIGENANTLSNLLDEMTVVDKSKRKKAKSKLKEKKATTLATEPLTVSEAEKEKIKWKKRKWNKDKKGEVHTETLNTSITVENLSISIILTYKKILADYFEKYGLIKRIGIAEVYPTEESKPVFTTTIIFNSDGAATQALEENNSILEGSRIRVKRPLPPTETTVLLRSYAELNEQNVTSLFTGIGKIRNIRHLVKGKKAMSTAFVEFDGPESVERAMKKCINMKIGSKKVHISKFVIRTLQKKSKTDEMNGSDSEG